MIWIRLFIILFFGLMGIYYGMLVLQCVTSWFVMTNREIRFGRCLVPFYYWIASTEEPKSKRTSDYADEDEDEIIEREKQINESISKKNTQKENEE